MPKIEDGLYNFISSRKKIFSVIAVVVLVGILGSVLNFYPEVFADQNLSYYLFSTVVQGFLALVGVLGAVALFKLQNVENEINNTMSFILPVAVIFRGAIANGYSSTQMIDEIEKVLGRKETLPERGLLQNAYDKLKSASNEKSSVRSTMVDFSLWSFITVLLALLGIPFTKLLIFYNLYFLTALYCITDISLSIGALFAAFVMIKRTLGYTYTMRAGTGKFDTVGGVANFFKKHNNV
jgi:hypothetical protein